MSDETIGPRRSSTRCATNGRRCTHSGQHGSHLGNLTSAKVSGNVICVHRSSTRCAANGRHCTHSGPHGSHMGGNHAQQCRKFDWSLPLIHSMRHKRPPLHPQRAAWQLYGGRLAPKSIVGNFDRPRRSSTRCAPKGRRCTHGGPHGSHIGGKPSAKVLENVIGPCHDPMRPQTAASAPTVGRMAAMRGGNLAPKCQTI
jgi:hypothetical protein